MELLLPKIEQPFTTHAIGGDSRKEGFEFSLEDGSTLKTLPVSDFAPGLEILVIEDGKRPLLPPAEWQPNFRAAAVMRAIYDTRISRRAA